MTSPQDGLLSTVYSSTATTPFDDAALAALLASSRARNATAEVTGMLLYRDGRFLQVLEGPDGVVRDLMARIAEDARHHSVRTLLEEGIADRQFPEWTMAFEAISDAVSRDMPGYREAFTDLDGAEDAPTTVRALRELVRWFQERTPRAA